MQAESHSDNFIRQKPKNPLRKCASLDVRLFSLELRNSKDSYQWGNCDHGDSSANSSIKFERPKIILDD